MGTALVACNPFDDYLHSFEQYSSNKWVKGTYVFRKVPAIYSEFQLNCSGGVSIITLFYSCPHFPVSFKSQNCHVGLSTGN